MAIQKEAQPGAQERRPPAPRGEAGAAGSSRPEARRVAMVCSHAIQYFMPWFQRLARHPRIDLTVVLCDDHGLEGASYDPGFGRAVQWDVPLLEGLRVVRLKNRAARPGVGRFGGIAAPGILPLLLRERFDAVVIHGWNYACYPLALAAARLAGVPVLLRGESPLLPGEAPPSERRDARGRLRQLILSRYLGLCAGALAVSSGNRRLLRALGVPEERVFLTPYSIDGERFALPEAERLRARAVLRGALGLPDDVPLILSVGKLQPVKDPLLLLSAYRALRARGVSAALCYVGDGELRPALQAAAAAVPDVHLLGFRNQSELPAVYAAADLFVLPSRRETFGLVVCEALSAGLPVVCSDGVGCAEDLVRPGETGLTFPVGDEARLADRLAELCSDGARRAALGRGARAAAAAWSFDAATDGLLRALDAVVLARKNDE